MISETTLCLSRHAEVRCQQRGISRDKLKLFMRMWDQESDVGNNCSALSISRAQCSNNEERNLEVSGAGQMHNWIVIWSHDQAQIVTIYHAGKGQKSKSFRRYFRGTKQ